MVFFLAGDQRNLVSGNFFAVYFHPFNTFFHTVRFADINLIFRISVAAFDLQITKSFRQTRIHYQTVIFRLDSEKRL